MVQSVAGRGYSKAERLTSGSIKVVTAAYTCPGYISLTLKRCLVPFGLGTAVFMPRRYEDFVLQHTL